MALITERGEIVRYYRGFARAPGPPKKTNKREKTKGAQADDAIARRGF